MTLLAVLLPLFIQSPPGYSLHGYGVDDRAVAQMKSRVDKGVQAVEKFFHGTFPKGFQVNVYAHRTGLDEFFKTRWKAPPTEKWMVAAGVADTLVILSPEAWKSEAVEHDGNDETEVRQIVTHELVHVYHAQQNPKPEFDGMDDMAWFVEGLATYASDQLTNREPTIRQIIASGKEPKSLATAWSGPARYGVSGSIVRYIDLTRGRPTVLKLLKATSNAEALRMLGTDESMLLKGWRDYETKVVRAP